MNDPGRSRPGQADEADIAAVAELLGRPPQAHFDVVVRDDAGAPVVIRNAPFLFDGTPMPTRYWLVGEQERARIGRLESTGAIDRAEAEIGDDVIAEAHDRYAAERDAAIPADHIGPRPFGGVGGTRRGIKCFHAHWAWHLAGGDDPVGRWIEAELAGQGARVDAPVLAAIDCGTNSTRLLVSRGGGAGKEPLARVNTITRLGRGVDGSGRLDADAIERTIDVLRDYRRILDEHGAERVRVTATSAARDAENRDEFFDAAEAVLGVRPELLSGEAEAELSFRGATAELDPADGPFLVVDIGGGSTEFIVGGEVLEASQSIDIGCVRFFEQYIEHDPPAPEELHACISVTEAWLEDIARDLPGVRTAKTFVGLAGTITTMAAVELGLQEWDRDAIHHFRFPRDAIEDVFRTLVTESMEDRMHNPGLEPARADVIVAGACIFVAIVRWLGVEECLVSESDILDGLVASL
ncbi:MAG TPA: DUF501 domain-containing protein, partial [Acidimicrobiales bacterium]